MPRGTGIAKRGFGKALTDPSRARFADGGDVNETAEELESLPEPAEKLESLKEEKAEHKTALDKVSEKIKKHIKDNVKFVTPHPNFKGVYKKGGKVEKVMHEWKTGKLHSGSKKGPLVKSRKQAIAIALSEAKRAKK
jgi:carbonic anhydrase